MKGYQEENLKAEQKLREATQQAQRSEKEVMELKRQVHDLQIAKMLVKEQVYVEPSLSEADLQTQNILGANAISQKQLKELQESIVKLRQENDALKREWSDKE